MNIQDLKNKLPHGAIRAIAEKANKTEATVSKFFSGQVSDKSGKIMIAIEEYVLELKNKETESQKKIKELVELI